MGGLLYVCGGGSYSDIYNKLKACEAYDPATDNGRLSLNMLSARSHPAGVEFDGKLYCFGGFDGEHALSTAEVFDPTVFDGGGEWTMLAPLPMARWSGAAMVVVGSSSSSCIAVMGGMLSVGSVGHASRLPMLYDIAHNSWSAASWTLPSPLSDFSAHPLRDAWLVTDNEDYKQGGKNTCYYSKSKILVANVERYLSRVST